MFENAPNIKIILYQDSFECCNPIGSARKKYKVTGVYMTLANINPWQRSKVDQIQLVALCFEKDIKTYGFFEILQPIISDINILARDGIVVNNTTHLKGTLLVVAGDNLGSHQIGGFSESFGSKNYVCRFCYKLGCSYVCNEEFKLRTPQSYDDDVDFALTTDQVYLGVKSQSALNLIDNYHVCNFGLPPCLAHDLFEGVIQYDLPLLLDKLVHEKHFSYDLLNQNIKNINFTQGFVKNIIPSLKKCDKLIGTASQNLYLINILPFLVFLKIDTNRLFNSEYWHAILILRKICNLLLCLQISIDQIAILKSLIEEYLELRVKLFETVPLRPKHHYLLHYPYLTKLYGPLRHLFTLRFESKHSYFKNVIRHCPNFKNMLLSLANKHQMLQSLQFSQGNQFEEKASVANAELFIADQFPKNLSATIKQNKIFGDSVKYISTSVTFRGICYSENMFICTGKKDDAFYTICKINYIILDKSFEDLCFFGFESFIYYNSESGLYLLKPGEQNKLSCFYFNQLLTVEPLVHAVTDNTDLFYFNSVPLEFM